jgi:2-polyprenyl-3-methyl-5-hydroxy-6-metoxy-1,4-benzoquinol methylase
MLTDVAGRERLGREREFWDRLYRDRAKEHKDTFAERYVHKSAYSRKVLHSRLGGLRHMKILSIGGGVDRLAVHLAQLENTVVTVDISPVAATLTRDLARESGVLERVSAVVGNCEEICFKSEFNVVLCKRALHHMNLRAVVPAASEALQDGGLFLAEEPICFLNSLCLKSKKRLALKTF